MSERTSQNYRLSVADPGGGDPGPLPLLKLIKEDGCHAGPQVLQVIGPPSDKFLDPLLALQGN